MASKKRNHSIFFPLVLGLGLFLAGSLWLLVTSFSTVNGGTRYITNHVDFDTESGSYNTSAQQAEFLSQRFDVPGEYDVPVSVVLGESTELKRIEVDLTNQRVYAYEGDKKVFDFLISSGKWGRTPTGEFTIWSKFKYTKMSGGSRALNTYYYLPNVPYVMFFSNAEVPGSRGFSLHGTYWHDNFGQPMSHGCVNMKTEEVAQLYEWAGPKVPDGQRAVRASKDNPGTTVIIYGEPPTH